MDLHETAAVVYTTYKTYVSKILHRIWFFRIRPGPDLAGFGISDPAGAGAGAKCSWAGGLGCITQRNYVTSNEIQTETRMWVWSTCPWWNREVQITEFVKQWIPSQLHSEADASKDGQIRPHIRPHIRRQYPYVYMYICIICESYFLCNLSMTDNPVIAEG